MFLINIIYRKVTFSIRYQRMAYTKFCMENYIVDSVPATAYYVSEFISEKEEKAIMANIYAAPSPKWTQLSNRRLQNWGGMPHSKGMIAEKIPPWLDEYLEKVHSINVMAGKRPNHILVNEYLPGQGIMPHVDGALFYPTITTISVGSHTVLKFLKPSTDDVSCATTCMQHVFSFLLEPRSLLVLQEELFNKYLHSIEELEADLLDNTIANLNMCSNKYKLGSSIKRDTRISLTIRHVPRTTTFKIDVGYKRII